VRGHISLARWFILGAIHGAKDYYEIAEAQLEVTRDSNLERIAAEVKSLGLGEEDEYNEWCLERQGHEATHEMLVPNYFRYSFLVLLYLVVEKQLKELCHSTKSERSIVAPVPEVRQGIVRAYERYLTEAAGLVRLNWQPVHDLNRIRNCIVHDSGCVLNRSDETELRQIAARLSGVSISGLGYRGIDDLHPLYLDNHMLVIETSYCRQVTAEIESLFTAICDSIPLLEPDFSVLMSRGQ
jgi:hypothetical protein